MNSRVDLMPEEYYATRIVRRKAIKWLSVMVFALGGVVVFIAFLRLQAANLSNKVLPLREMVANTQELGEQVAPLANKLNAALKRQEVVHELVAEPAWNGLMHDIAASMESGLWLTQCNVATEKRNKDKDGKETEEVHRLNINGQAQSNEEIIRFMKQLSSSVHLSALELQESSISRRSERAQTIQFGLRGIVQ